MVLEKRNTRVLQSILQYRLLQGHSEKRLPRKQTKKEGEIEKPTHPLHVCHDLHNHTGRRPHVALVSWSYFLLTGVLVFGLTQAQRTESAKLAAKMPLLTTCPREKEREKSPPALWVLLAKELSGGLQFSFCTLV